jgi:hypothetical protein
VAATADLMQEKLEAQALLDDPTETETNLGALFQRWKVANGLTEWEDYVAEIFSVATTDFFPDAENEYWDAFTPA